MPASLNLARSSVLRGTTSIAICGVYAVLFAAAAAGAQRAATPKLPESTATAMSGPALHQVVQDAVAQEISLVRFGRPYLRYRVHTRDSKGDQVREVIESKDGTVARLKLRDGKPLTDTEDAAERQRLQGMLDAPTAFQKHKQKDENGKKMAVDMVSQLPDAMVFTAVQGQPQREGHSGPAEIVLDFEPNSGWKPPTMLSQALTGVKGRAWVDARTHTMTRLELTIFQPVNFGFGMLVRIFPGGSLTLEQVPVGDTRWIADRFTEHVTLRAMLVKTVNENTDLYAFDFAPIKEMSYQEAIQTLLSAPSGNAANGTPSR